MDRGEKHFRNEIPFNPHQIANKHCPNIPCHLLSYPDVPLSEHYLSKQPFYFGSLHGLVSVSTLEQI